MRPLVFFLSLIGIVYGGSMAVAKPKYEEAIFAMGCFWCGESEFRDHGTLKPLPGIISIRVGYAGGTKPNPTYESHEGYKEAVKIVFDPTKITYDQLLDIFWHNIDPFDDKGQFCDTGPQYASAVYVKDDHQKIKATEKKELTQHLLSKENIVTEIRPYTSFYDAEEYHQNYKQKNPKRYAFYRWKCGRDQRLGELWGNSLK